MREVAATPRVSVVMSVYNGERYLAQSIKSILNQTLTDFEFIIVDDGSTDSSLPIIRAFQDPRIHIIVNEKNLGLAASLNIGIAESQGAYIARMDYDDISLDNRLDTQAKFLENNPEISVVGSWCVYIDENGKRLGKYRYPTRPSILLWLMHFSNQLAHPSVMIRRTFFSQFHYDERCIAAQDYELWARAAEIMKYGNIPQYLFLYRIHGSQMWKLTTSHLEAGKNISLEAMGILQSRTIGDIIPKNIINGIVEPSDIESSDEFQAIIKHIISLIKIFIKIKTIDIWENLLIRGETSLIIINIGIRAKKISKIKRLRALWAAFRLLSVFPLFYCYKKIFL